MRKVLINLFANHCCLMWHSYYCNYKKPFIINTWDTFSIYWTSMYSSHTLHAKLYSGFLLGNRWTDIMCAYTRL